MSRKSARVYFIVLPVIAAAVTLYAMDQVNYNKGHQAYQQADCVIAIQSFDKVVNRWRLIEFGNALTQSQQEKSECMDFQEGVDRQRSANFSGALIAYNDFIDTHDASPLTSAAVNRMTFLFGNADPAALTSTASCDRMRTFREKNVIPQLEVRMPLLYSACGKTYDAAGDDEGSFLNYEALLEEYPTHPLASEAATALLANPTSCEQISSIENSPLAQYPEFLPSLYYQCGQYYAGRADLQRAIDMYEAFLKSYPDHARAPDVEAGLAAAIVEQAKSAPAGEIPPPQVSGTTASGQMEVVIQNDSPHRLRIVFQGPESRIEELEGCSTCTTYFESGPLFCPEQGPIGRYTLAPGQYDVVVNALDDPDTTPWTGDWDLVQGDEYYSCFIVVRTFAP